MTAAAAGLLLALWALFWDRSRGRKRCPKCWYNMEGVPRIEKDERPSRRCPECGKEIRHERQLLRTRKRWAIAATGVLAILLANNARFVYERENEEWSRWVPSSVLIPFIRPTGLTARHWAMDVLRARTDRLWPWQVAMIQQRDVRIEPNKLAGLVRTRPRWPVGVPVRVWLDSSDDCTPNVGWARLAAGSVGESAPQAVIHLSSPSSRIRSFSSGHRWYFNSLARTATGAAVEPVTITYGGPDLAENCTLLAAVRDLSFDIVDSVDEAIKPVPSDEIEGLLRRQLRVGGPHPLDDMYVALDWCSEFRAFQLAGISYWPRVELIVAGKTVAATEWDDAHEPSSAALIESEGGPEPRSRRGPIAFGKYPLESATIRISGSARAALMQPWATRYWSGSFEVPALEMIRPPE